MLFCLIRIPLVNCLIIQARGSAFGTLVADAADGWGAAANSLDRHSDLFGSTTI